MDYIALKHIVADYGNKPAVLHFGNTMVTEAAKSFSPLHNSIKKSAPKGGCYFPSA